MNSETFKTLKTFDNATFAHLLKCKLESEGIPAFVIDENIVGLNPLYANAVGGIKVKVNEPDLERSKQILREIDSSLVMEDEKIISCPKCNSKNLDINFKSFKGIKGILSLFVSIVLVIYPLYYKSTYH